MEDIESEAKSIVEDLKSCDPFTEKVCEFISNCVLETLSNPSRVVDIEGFDYKEFLDRKKRAEVEINENLKTSLNLDCSVGKVVSVFEKASFFEDILHSLSGIQEFNARSSHNASVTSRDPDVKCNLKTGHVDLDLEAFRKANLTLARNKRFISTTDDAEDTDSFRPVLKPPLTKSEFKLVNMSGFLSLSKFCQCCKERLNLCNQTDPGNSANVTFQSNIIFQTNGSLFKPLVKRLNDEALNEIKIDNTFSTCSTSKAHSPIKQDEPLPKCSTSKAHSPIKQDEPLPNETTHSIDVCDKFPQSKVSDFSEVVESHNVGEVPLTDLDIGFPSVDGCKLTVLEEARDKILSEIADNLCSEMSGQEICDIKTSDDSSQVDISKRSYTKTDVVTSKQILDEIYCKYKENQNSKLLKSRRVVKTLKEKLEMMSNNGPIAKNSPIGSTNGLNHDISKRHIVFSKQPSANSEKQIVLKDKPVQKLQINVEDECDGYSDCVPSKSLVNDPLNIIGTSEGAGAISPKRKIIITEDHKKTIMKLAKMLKKEKIRRKKLARNKKVEIDLSPPDGVSLDAFLYEQIENIRLMTGSVTERGHDKTDLPDLIRDQIGKGDISGHKNGKLLSSSTISTALNSSVESTQRKVISYSSTLSKYSHDSNCEGQLDELPTTSTAHSTNTEMSYSNSLLKCSNSYQIAKKYGSLECENSVGNSSCRASSPIILSDDEIDSCKDNPRPARRKSRSPWSYSKRRFQSISPSPPPKRNHRYSGSPPRGQRSPRRLRRNRYSQSPSPTRRSSYRRPFRRRSRSRSTERNVYRRDRRKFNRFANAKKSISPFKPYKSNVRPDNTPKKGLALKGNNSLKTSNPVKPRQILSPPNRSRYSSHPKPRKQSENVSPNEEFPSLADASSISDSVTSLSPKNQHDIHLLDLSPVSECNLINEYETTTTIIEEKTYYS